MCGGQLEELCGPAEGLPDGLARQVSVVGPGIASSPTPARAVGATRAPVPAVASMSKLVIRRWRPPGPSPPASMNSPPGRLRHRSGSGRSAVLSGFPRPAVAAPEPGLPYFAHVVVAVWVMADQRGVDDGDPPHRLTDHSRTPAARPPRAPRGSRPVASPIAVRAHTSALAPAFRSPIYMAHDVPCGPARGEQNRACSRRGSNAVPHCSQLRISAIGSYYA